MCASDLSSHVFQNSHLNSADAQAVTQYVRSHLQPQHRYQAHALDAVTYLERLACLCPTYGTLSPAAKHWCSQLATYLTHRDTSADFMQDFSQATIQAVRQQCRGLTYTQKIHLEEILLRAQAIITALLPTLPGSAAATVIEVAPEGNEIAVVRLQVAATAIADGYTWQSGQYVSVQTHLQAGLWRDFCIATPPNPRGEIELHVRRQGTLSRLLATARPGDIWQITPGQGGFYCAEAPHEIVDISQRSADRLYVAYDTGFAPFQSLLLEQMQYPSQQRVHMYVCAASPSQLYPLMNLWQYASAAPWLNITPLATQDSDPWWVEPCASASPLPGLPLPQIASAGSYIADFGPWLERDIFIAGPADFVTTTRETIVAGGTPASQVFELSYQDAPSLFSA